VVVRRVAVRRVAMVDDEERRRFEWVMRKMLDAELHWRLCTLPRYIL
jgi:hypothetical protein